MNSTLSGYVRVFYSFSGKIKLNQEKIATAEHGGGRRGQDIHLEMVPLKVPSVPPSMNSCKCIKISYRIQVNTLGSS